MDYKMPNTFIIIKGQPKALQIERFQMGDNGVYDVKFKSSPRTYHYRYSDVVWLKDAVWHDHLHCKVTLVRENSITLKTFVPSNKENKRIGVLYSTMAMSKTIFMGTSWRVPIGNSGNKEVLVSKIITFFFLFHGFFIPLPQISHTTPKV